MTSQSAPAFTSRFLDMNLLAALERMRFQTRQRVEGSYSGRHTSRQIGGVGEFVDYRDYSPGEDLRRLDWKVYARTGKPYVRLFQDETNLSCMLAIDVSNSMLFGAQSEDDWSGSKIDYAQYLTTSLAHIISCGQDHAGLAVLSDQLINHVAPAGAPSHTQHLMKQIESIEVRRSTTLAPGLQTLFQTNPAKGVLLLVSDFLFDDLSEVFSTLRLFRHRHFEVILLHLVHPGEERLPVGSAFRFEGLEGEGAVNCSPIEIAREYEQAFADHLQTVREFALAIGCDYRRVSLSRPWVETLGDFLVYRSG